MKSTRFWARRTAKFSVSHFLCCWLLLAGANSVVAQTVTSSPAPQSFGQVSANGTSPASLTLTYSVAGATPSFALRYRSDFTLIATNCSGSGTVTCSITVNFLPRLPGLRQDAVLVKNTSGSVIATTLLSGIGLAPKLAVYPGVISTIAGTGAWGYSGDGRAASLATIRNPQGVAADNQGNLYIADSVNQVVREVNAITGQISTVVGNGAVGYTGDGGTATQATLNNPAAVALDGAGNLYVVDQGNNAIRRIDAATQQISTVAGGGLRASGSDGLGDGGQATGALLNGPNDIAVDAAGALYIADSMNGLVRKVDAATGIISVIAGGGTSSGIDGMGDSGAATNSHLNDPLSVALDTAGNIYIADSGNSMIRRVDAVSKIITVVAGNGVSGYNGDLGLATGANLGSPSGVRLDSAGNIYIADKGANVIRQVNIASGVIRTIAGTGAARFIGDGGSPINATLASPAGLALDSNGNVYVADLTNNAIRKIALGTTPQPFPTTFVGQASVPQPVSVLNIGNQPLNISAITLSTNFRQQMLGVSDCSTSFALSAGATCTVAIQFVPVQTGPVAGSLTLTTNSANVSNSFLAASMSATGATGATPQLTFSVASLAFGNQSLGTSSVAQTITLSNPGSAPLYLSSIQIGGVNSPDFGVTNNCQLVLPGATCSVAVTFSPSSIGSRSASLVFVDNVANSPQSVTLSGTGTGTAQILLSAAGVQFGSRSIGSPASVKTVNLSNVGSGPLNSSSTSVSGANAADFTVSTTCGSAVAAGASCSINVSFSPRALGLRTAKFILTDNLAGSPQTIVLSGTGRVKAYPAVWRPSNGDWYLLNGSWAGVQWGLPGDIPVPGDYDGDGKVDLAVFRPSNGTWYIVPSSTGISYTVGWGSTGDMPVPGDYDGDGKTDVTVYRPSNGNWYILPSSTSVCYVRQFGQSGDVPVLGDYDGDGKTDVAVYRPSNGTWYILPSSTSVYYARQFGQSGDVPVLGDYDGDGKTDIAVYRASTGDWFILPSGTPTGYIQQKWGIAGDVPVPGDYDGDGKVDIAVWRPSNGLWFAMFSGAIGQSGWAQWLWGMPGDTPLIPPAS